jgi:O-antigen/teichoic acid export membrane protein
LQQMCSHRAESVGALIPSTVRVRGSFGPPFALTRARGVHGARRGSRTHGLIPVEPTVPEGSTSGRSLPHLAARGALVVGVRGAASRLVALAGTIVFARTLSTEDFGVFAFGATLLISISALVQAGLGAGLIRRPTEPTEAELQTVVAVNGMLLLGCAIVVTAVCAIIGGRAIAIALMIASIPVTAFRAPGVVAFERSLTYRPLAVVEISETVALYGVGAVLVAAGMGLTGIAVAATVRAVGGTLLMVRASCYGIVRPNLSRPVARDLAGFASRYQGLALVNFVRDQSINVAIATVGGAAMLGAFAIASRVLQAPQILLEALFRVSYPAMSRLKEYGEDGRNVLERTVKAVALGTGLIVAPLCAASAPLVPEVFGERWSAAASVIPPVSLGLMIGGPVAVAAAGYLFAVDAGGVAVRSAVLHTIAWFVVAVPLLIPLGVVAAGLGTLAASIVEALVLGRAARRRTGARILGALLIPVLTATASAGAGAGAIAVVSLNRALEASIAATVAVGVYGILLILLQRAHVKRFADLLRGASRPATA